MAVSRQVKTVGKPALGGSWSLVDMHGRPTTDADFRGQYILLYFGFTHCPDICPSELVKVGRIIDDLGALLPAAYMLANMSGKAERNLQSVFCAWTQLPRTSR